VQQIGLVQQHGAAAVAVHRARGATEIQVDAFGAQTGQHSRVVGQTGGIGAQQLRAHGRAGARAAPVVQFGHGAMEGADGQQTVGDADELRHATVDASHLRERVPQVMVEQALHGGQQDAARDRGFSRGFHAPMILTSTRLRRRPSNSP